VRRTRDPQMSFIQVQLDAQGIRLDVTLQAVSDFLDEHGELLNLVTKDLVRGLKNPGRGREGLNAERVLRAFILQRVKNWDLRELRERIADGYTIRNFTCFRGDEVPKHDAFHRAFTRLTPATVEKLNEAVVKAATKAGLVDSTRVRVDTTHVETDIHYPTDASLLWDSVRVVSRLVGGVKKLAPSAARGFNNRTRRARRRMQEISRFSQKDSEEKRKVRYRDLIKVTERAVAQAWEVVERARKIELPDLMDDLALGALGKKLERFCDLAKRVLVQTRRRVLKGEKVPADEKLVSIFEDHTDIVVRGKARKPAEFGHKVFLAQSGSKIITDYAVLDGNPPDEQRVGPTLEKHERQFGAAPELFAGDRGFYSAANIGLCEEAGVESVCIPQRGGNKTEERVAEEKTPQFKRGQKFRAGIEGTISGLLRGRGMRRCMVEGRERFEVFVGAVVLAYNLLVIAELLAAQKSRRRKRA